MKIIDFVRKGNVVRFMLGENDLEDWYGDDWDDAPYEYNAGTVYDEFVAGYYDVALPFDCLVLEPCDGTYNSQYCKDDMKARRVPCIIVVPARLIEESNSLDNSFAYWVGAEDCVKYYFGDPVGARAPTIKKQD